MSKYLGWKPIKIDVVLNRDADFVAHMRLTDGDTWSSGTEVVLFVEDAEWPADVGTNTLSWNVDKEDVNEVLDDRPVRTRLYIKENDLDILWGTGRVINA